jgi:hypothetical protein
MWRRCREDDEMRGAMVLYYCLLVDMCERRWASRRDVRGERMGIY